MVSKLLTIITGRLSPWIFESTHGLKLAIKQDDQSFISIKIDRLIKFYIVSNRKIFNNSIFYSGKSQSLYSFIFVVAMFDLNLIRNVLMEWFLINRIRQ